MGKWLLAICVAIMGATLVATEADAKRLGGGRSVGAQRNVTPAPAKPAQQAAPQQAPQAQPAQQGSRWGMLGGILGGLALGGLLGYLFSGSGLGGILLIALLAFAVVMLVRAFARRGEVAQLAGSNQTMAVPERPLVAGAVSPAPAIPAGFDAGGFL